MMLLNSYSMYIQRYVSQPFGINSIGVSNITEEDKQKSNARRKIEQM